VDIIKERVNNRCILRTDAYGKSVEKFNQLVAAAQADFPQLLPEDVEVVFSRDQVYARMTGIEFDMPDDTVIPADYTTVPEVKSTL